MNADDRLAEAAKQLRLAARDDDLTATQQTTARHLAGVIDGLETSVKVLDEAEIVRDSTGTPPGSYLPAETVDDDDLRTDGGSPTTERAVEKLRDEDVRTDGGHRHGTDKRDGTLIAECPNATGDGDHLVATVEYTRAVHDDLPAQFADAFPECGECGADLQMLATEEQTEVLTDGSGIDPYGPPPADSPAQRRQREQQPDPSEQCIECGTRGDLFCGCCGFPLCGKHHELGAGFCSEHHTIGGVAVCTYDFEVYVGVHPSEETVLVTDGDADVYHLPDEYDAGGDWASQAPACRPAEDSKVRISLANAHGNELELCEHCAEEARERHEQFREEIAAELEDGGSA